jgi:hypothetical protein
VGLCVTPRAQTLVAEELYRCGRVEEAAKLLLPVANHHR